jgi:replicative DNA helicase
VIPASPPNSGEPFVGAIYEPEVMVAGDRHAEMAIVFLALTTPDYQESDLDEKDFNWSDTRYIYGEYQRMKEAGVPPYDKAAQIAWFKRPDAIERMKLEDLDWFDEYGKPSPWADIFQLVIDSGFATMANLAYYRATLRKWKVIRGIRYIGYEMHSLIDADPEKYEEVVAWADDSIQRLKQVAATITPQS